MVDERLWKMNCYVRCGIGDIICDGDRFGISIPAKLG
jgi:hypothetical protein